MDYIFSGEFKKFVEISKTIQNFSSQTIMTNSTQQLLAEIHSKLSETATVEKKDLHRAKVQMTKLLASSAGDVLDASAHHNHEFLSPPVTDAKIPLTSHESNSRHSSNHERSSGIEKTDDVVSAEESHLGNSQSYLASLLHERTQLQDNPAVKHVLDLLDKEIERIALSKVESSTDVVTVIEKKEKSPITAPILEDVDDDEEVTLSETVVIPVAEFPTYNFIGRILGPRGMTAKQLEKDTGCRIMIRGRYSNKTYGHGHRLTPQRKTVRPPIPASENDRYEGERFPENEVSSTDMADLPLRVVIETSGPRRAAEQRIVDAVDVVKTLLVPPCDGRDELKRRQLVELAIMNGTYRPPPAWQASKQSPYERSACLTCPPPTPKEEPSYPIPADFVNNLLASQPQQNIPFNVFDNQTTQTDRSSQGIWKPDDPTVNILSHLLETLGNQQKPPSQPQSQANGGSCCWNTEMTSRLLSTMLAMQTRVAAATVPTPAIPAPSQNYAASQLLYSLPSKTTPALKLAPPPKRNFNGNNRKKH
ncbi:unnamed protein product [Caenorhabditis auriculariae]|uniref:K Homology domain-containing protein n=1 Tax=Caenorhabditis auriculariae TaxID=2777116 RepID=A0A8S1HJX0_9PELO|nr:unnamed protein product [Caenorhabditis auriculariae]